MKVRSEPRFCRSTSRSLVQSPQSVVQIRDQVVDTFEPDVQTHAWPARCPPRHRANTLRINRKDEALEAAPAEAHLEQSHAIQHRRELIPARRLQHDGEQARRTFEIAPP